MLTPAQIIATADEMRAERSSEEATWAQINSFVIPEANAILVPGSLAAGENRVQVVDNAGEQAHELLAAAVVFTNTPDIVDWFELETDDEQLNRTDEVALWLEDATRRLAGDFRRPFSGFAAAQHEKYQDVVGFGTGGSLILDEPGFGLTVQSIPLQQLLIRHGARDRLDTVYRDFTLTAKQAVEEWGNRAGPKVVEAAGRPRDATKLFRFIHAVWPNRKTDAGSRMAAARPFLTCTVGVEDRVEIEQGGFFSMPYQVPRWRKRAGRTYGRGCGHVALPDVKALQRTATVGIRGGEKQIDPALLVADDGVLGPVRTGNGRINYVRRDGFSQRPAIEPLLTGGQPQIADNMMDRQIQRIEGAFFKPLVQMVRKDRMTAQEVLTVKAENEQVLGPYIARLKQEDLGPTVLRAYDLRARQRGGFLPMPAIMRDREVRVGYVSPAVKAQRIAAARGLAQFSEITNNLTAMQPDLLDNIDLDLAYRDTADGLGLPKRWQRAVEKRDALRKARADAMQAERERQNTLEAVDTAANAAKALPAVSQALQSPTEALGG